MIALVVLGVLTLAGVLGWFAGPDTRDPDYSMRARARRPPTGR